MEIPVGRASPLPFEPARTSLRIMGNLFKYSKALIGPEHSISVLVTRIKGTSYYQKVGILKVKGIRGLIFYLLV